MRQVFDGVIIALASATIAWGVVDTIVLTVRDWRIWHRRHTRAQIERATPKDGPDASA